MLVLELRNRVNVTGFSFVLFALLWILPFAFVLLINGLRRSPDGSDTRAYVRPLLAAACLMFIVWFWVVIVIDQMPCFLGLPNCD